MTKLRDGKDGPAWDAREPSQVPALIARGLIRLYRYSLSSVMGRTCRHLPTCSEFTEEAIGRHGLWRGGWVGLARIARCRPGGSDGFDPVPGRLPPSARWYLPWRYGSWRTAPHRQEGLEPR